MLYEDPKIVSQPKDAEIIEKCVVCGNACHCGEVSLVGDSNCGVCYHTVEEVDDYIKMGD